MEDSKQLILEGQHHVVLRTIGKEAFSYPQKQVMTCFGAAWELVGGGLFGCFAFLKVSDFCKLLY